MFVRLFVDENLDRIVPISKQPKEKIQAIIDSCTRQFPEFAERARKRIRTYLKSCRRNKRGREGAAWDAVSFFFCKICSSRNYMIKLKGVIKNYAFFFIGETNAGTLDLSASWTNFSDSLRKREWQCETHEGRPGTSFTADANASRCYGKKTIFIQIKNIFNYEYTYLLCNIFFNSW